MVTQKQLVLELKANLEKAKASALAAKEAAEATKLASYNRRMEETEIRLAEELAEVCRDYCKETWEKTLDLAKVLTTSEWRQPGNVHYHSTFVKFQFPPHLLLPLPQNPPSSL